MKAGVGFCEDTVTLYGKAYRAVMVHSSAHDKRRPGRLERELAASPKQSKAAAQACDGTMIAVPEAEWTVFYSMSTATFAQTLKRLTNKVNLAKFKRHKRRPRKPRAKPTRDPSQPHVSTAKLLKGE